TAYGIAADYAILCPKYLADPGIKEDDGLYGACNAGSTVGLYSRRQEPDVVRCGNLLHPECA
ncbi:MAG: hypothetical protein V8S95_10980, partial [Odoribacter sp.]